MAKAKTQQRKIGPIRPIIITLPEGTEGDILKLNPHLANIKFYDVMEGVSKPVFAGIGSSAATFKILHYVVLMGWLESPFLQNSDFESRKLDCARAAGILKQGQRLADMSPKNWGERVGRDEVELKIGTTARTWLDNFLLFQQHAPFQFFIAAQQALSKVTGFVEQIQLSHTDENVTEKLELLMSYASTITGMVVMNEEIHKRLLYVRYSMEQLRGELPEERTEETSFASAMVGVDEEVSTGAAPKDDDDY